MDSSNFTGKRTRWAHVRTVRITNVCSAADEKHHRIVHLPFLIEANFQLILLLLALFGYTVFDSNGFVEAVWLFRPLNGFLTCIAIIGNICAVSKTSKRSNLQRYFGLKVRALSVRSQTFTRDFSSSTVRSNKCYVSGWWWKSLRVKVTGFSKVSQPSFNYFQHFSCNLFFSEALRYFFFLQNKVRCEKCESPLFRSLGYANTRLSSFITN